VAEHFFSKSKKRQYLKKKEGVEEAGRGCFGASAHLDHMQSHDSFIVEGADKVLDIRAAPCRRGAVNSIHPFCQCKTVLTARAFLLSFVLALLPSQDTRATYLGLGARQRDLSQAPRRRVPPLFPWGRAAAEGSRQALERSSFDAPRRCTRRSGEHGDGERGRRAGPYLAPKQKESAVKTELLPEPLSPPMKLICAQITELVVLLVTAAEGSRTACRAREACCAFLLAVHPCSCA